MNYVIGQRGKSYEKLSTEQLILKMIKIVSDTAHSEALLQENDFDTIHKCINILTLLYKELELSKQDDYNGLSNHMKYLLNDYEINIYQEVIYNKGDYIA